MNEQEKQIYETLKTARNYLLKHLDMLQKEIKNESVGIDIGENIINQANIQISALQASVLNLQQQGVDDQLIQLLNESIEVLIDGVGILENDKQNLKYGINKIKDKIKIYMSKINDIDHTIETFLVNNYKKTKNYSNYYKN